MANNKGNTYELLTPEKIDKQKSRKNKPNPQQNNYSYNPKITNQWDYQRDLHTIGIYDHEWFALKKITRKIKVGCSKFNLGNLVDGFGAGISIPFCLNLFKLITAEIISSDLRNETLFYFICFVIFLILEGIKYFINPEWLTNYSTLCSDVETLDDRFNEIDERIGISKKEE